MVRDAAVVVAAEEVRPLMDERPSAPHSPEAPEEDEEEEDEARWAAETAWWSSAVNNSSWAITGNNARRCAGWCS